LCAWTERRCKCVFAREVRALSVRGVASVETMVETLHDRRAQAQNGSELKPKARPLGWNAVCACAGT